MTILERFKKNTMFTEEQWNQFHLDLQNESIQYICKLYGMKKIYVKEYKKHYMGS